MPLRAPKYSGAALLLIAFCVILFAFWRWASVDTPVNVLAHHYEIPPSFNGVRILYGMTLAVLLPMSLFSFGQAVENVRYLVTATGDLDTPAKVHVTNDLLILLCIFISVTPDAIVLLAWGDESAPSASTLALFDRAMDMVSGLLFLAAVVRRIRSRAIILFMLQQEPIPIDLVPTWEMLWPKLRLGLVIVLISFGVAFAK